jgi:hypothetical protein
MEILGLSSTTPRSDSRLKALFWPTIQHDGDLEYITEQGFWICTLIAAMSLVLTVLAGRPFSGLFQFSFFFLAGVGVRQRSLAASIAVFVVYSADKIALWRLAWTSFSLIGMIIIALLLANVRGILISSEWAKQNELPHVDRLNQTFLDKLSGHWPELLWPKTKYLFALLAVIELILVGMLLAHPPTFRQLAR